MNHKSQFVEFSDKKKNVENLYFSVIRTSLIMGHVAMAAMP